ncbi:MAG: hypothetical protein NC110_05325 [Ruminococcus sp.]|nr:hypothetical protein [Ruminococcus sp.]
MGGFTGSYEHNLDSKNRVFVPAKFRDMLGESFVIRVKPSRYPHVECFTEQAFEEKVKAEVAPFTDESMRERMLFASRSNASVVTVDSQGRICITSKILKYSKIEKESLFIGMGEYVQIWNPEIYDDYFMEISTECAEEEEAALAEARQRRKYKAQGRFLDINNNLGE